MALVLATPITVLPSQAEAQARQSRPTATQARPAGSRPARQAARTPARSTPAAAPAARPAATAVLAPAIGPAAIRAANAEALAPSRADGFVNAAQVFGYETGRVYEVWTAPMRITTITLEPGETITSKAAGDTERWMIGDTTSGDGVTRQSQILIKPFRAGIATNMVITTNRRMYLLSLRSAESTEAFNAVVTWTYAAPLVASPAQAASVAPASTASAPARTPRNENYRIRAGWWGRPDWTPVSVADDGRQTFITFPETLGSTEAPPLFVLSETGEAQLVNWRKQGNTYVVDRLFDRAELRLGGERPGERSRVVRIERKGDRDD
jgi:type IV secretion system protein VirB9